VRINVVVEPDELRPAIDRTARRLSREVRVPGFRKGKVPRQVIEARIGREALLAEAIEHEAVPEFYAKAIDELGVQPLSRARVEPPDYTDGQPLEFSATFDVKPELDLPPYRGIEVERPALEVTDEHVDAQLERLRERTAQLEVIGRPLTKGDFAQIDLRATHHTDEIPELTRTDFLYEVGSGTVVPQLDEELEGSARATSSASTPPCPRRPARSWPAARSPSRSWSRRPRPRSCPSWTTTSPRRPASSTPWRSSGPTCASAWRARPRRSGPASWRPGSSRPTSTRSRFPCPSRWSTTSCTTGPTGSPSSWA